MPQLLHFKLNMSKHRPTWETSHQSWPCKCSLSPNHTSIHPISQPVTKASSMTSFPVISHQIMTPSPPKHHSDLPFSAFLLPLELHLCPCLSPGPAAAPSILFTSTRASPPVPLHPAPTMVFLSVGYCLSCKRRRNPKKMHVGLPFVWKEIREGKPKLVVWLIPTEVEWESCCKSTEMGTGREYSWGWRNLAGVCLFLYSPDFYFRATVMFHISRKFLCK